MTNSPVLNPEANAGAPEVLRVEDLNIDFVTDAGAVPAVRGVDLQVKAGEILAIVGESGSGKSVTARTALGILAENGASRGGVYLKGKNMLTLRGHELRASHHPARLSPLFPCPHGNPPQPWGSGLWPPGTGRAGRCHPVRPCRLPK